jgi:hypothetical protein
MESSWRQVLLSGSALSQNCSRKRKALCTACSQIASCEHKADAVLSCSGVSRNLIFPLVVWKHFIGREMDPVVERSEP